MGLELNLTEKEKKVAEVLGVEERHYQEVINQSDNLSKEDFYLNLGILYSDCIKLKVAAEQLGFKAEEVGSGYHGYPGSYHLTKITEEVSDL